MQRSAWPLLLLLAGCASGGGGGEESTKAAPATALLSEVGRTNLALAQAALEQNKLPDAEDRAKRALQTDPGSAKAHALMGLVHYRLQRHDKATAEFNRALAMGPRDGVVQNLYGSWACERGDFAAADAAYQVAMQSGNAGAPAQVYANAGRCAVRAKQYAKAQGYLRRAVELAPRDRNVLLMLAESELALGHTLAARAFVQRSDALGPDADTLTLAARIEDASGDAVAAARYRKRLREEFPAAAPTGEGARQQ